MAVRFVNQRLNHQSPGAFFDYQVKESEALGYGRTAPLYCGDKYVCRVTRDQFELLCQGKWIDGTPLRRRHPKARMGDLLSCSVPSTVAGAMKLSRIADDPKGTFRLLFRGLAPAMREAAKRTYGRSTGGKLVKGEPLYVVFPGYANRAGEFNPQLNVFLLPTVRTAEAKAGGGRKHLALHNPPLYRAQKTLQGAWDMGVAKALHERTGVVCGPKGHSFVARGVRANTHRSAQMNARLKATRFTGPKARTRAARSSRGPKRVPSYREALDKFVATAVGRIQRKATQWSEEKEAKFSRRCVEKAFRYHLGTTALFTNHDVYATAAHLALPNVRPEVFAREFEALTAKPERFGVEVKQTYPDGGVMYAPAGAAKVETKAAKALWAIASVEKGGGLSRDQVAWALAGSGCPQPVYEKVQALADGKRLTVDAQAIHDAPTLRVLAAAYAANKRQVHAVGAAAGTALDVPAHSARGFAESLVRTSHLRALWRGLRTPGPLSFKLKVAEHIRKHGHTKLGRGALVVAAVNDAGDIASVARIAEVARRAKGKLVLTGPGARDYAALLQEAGATQTAKARTGAGMKS